jgi:hypothetical protein
MTTKSDPSEHIEIILGVARRAFPNAPLTLSPEQITAACTLYETAVRAKDRADRETLFQKMKAELDSVSRCTTDGFMEKMLQQVRDKYGAN